MKKIRDLFNKFLVGMWVAFIFIALFTKDKEMIIIAITTTFYAFPLYIRCLKEEE